MDNAYPELPVVQYRQTSVPMTDVIDAFRRLDVPVEVRRSAYIIFRNESSNGKSGINNNYVGAQADGGRWPAELDPLFTATVELRENGTNKLRRFVAFASVRGCVAFLCNRVESRGLFVGGTVNSSRLHMEIDTPRDLGRAYFKEWVRGSAAAEPDAATQNGFLSMYGQAQGFFA